MYSQGGDRNHMAAGPPLQQINVQQINPGMNQLQIHQQLSGSGGNNTSMISNPDNK